MSSRLVSLYKQLVIDHPIKCLFAIILLIILAGIQASNFKLDASADSLVLEDDQDLRYYLKSSERYATQEFLFITYQSKRGDLLSDEVLGDIRKLSNELLALERVDSVMSILNVPLVDSPRVSFSDLSKETRTLETKGIDKELARKELISSPLYRNLIISEQGDITALQVNLVRDETYRDMVKKRNALRQKKWDETISDTERKQLNILSKEVKAYTAKLFDQQAKDIAAVRNIIDQHRDHAQLFLGGVPMITSDMISYIENDLIIFGVAVLAFLIITLTIIFRQPRWIILPIFCCFLSGYVMLGFLGWVDWPVTVISSNFISLLLIITMSLTIHLIVRYRELHAKKPDASQQELVFETVRQMSKPCFFTAITTIAAFGSLVVSGIRPVIDFGYMMMVGISFAFTLSFILFPAATVLLSPGKARAEQDFTTVITLAIASFTERFAPHILWGSLIMALIGLYGVSQLEVENRFIDYFKDDTEIHQGMLLIDQKLGGTMPLDVVISADKDFYKFLQEHQNDDFDESEALFGDEDDLSLEGFEGDGEEVVPSYWYNSAALERLEKVHDYISSLNETGKVISLATSMKLVTKINNDVPLDDLELAILKKKLPEEINRALINPYVSEDGNEARITMRIIESDPNLRRGELIKKIESKLIEEFGFKREQVRTTNMLVLYNNMLQSLFRSQIMTLGVVMLSIMVMFMLLFRSLYIALVAIIPNVISALLILGIMGLLQIPLDLMTITIAAITIGIAVDNTIHYIHRFRTEFPKDRDYVACVRRCHGSIGKAMYFTSLTIIIGFSILVLSNFIPTIYFGILTAIAMLIALFADLVLLPRLMVVFKPLGKAAT